MRSTVLLERYEVVRDIGSGAAGELFLVRDRKAGLAPCALKVLRPRRRDPELAPLFRSEFLLLSDLRHESIVAVHDFGVLETGEPFFTMDFLAGETCRTFVNEDRLDAIEYVDLAAHLLSALASVHARGILHRDIKPENIIMRRGGGRLLPVLVDFGLAVSAAVSRSGEATGTLPYIAPEVIAGAPAEPRSDLFALGMVLYEAATGGCPAEQSELLRDPAKTLSPDRVRRSFRQQARGAVPKRYEEIVVRLLDPVPARRPASAAAALAALAGIYGDEFFQDVAEIRQTHVVSEPPLVGRKSALDLLLQRMDALADGTLLDPIVVVAGGAGSGVTRLLATLRNHASAAGMTAVSAGDLEELASELAQTGMAARTNAGPAKGESAAQSIFRCETYLHGAPPDRKCVLLLDDVHDMGSAEADALRAWISTLESSSQRSRLLLVLGGRHDAQPPGAEILRTAGRAVPVDLRDLPPLSAADIGAAVSVVLGAPRVPAPFAQQLHRASGGNARLFTEQLRLLVARGVIDLSGDEPVLRPEKLKKVALPSSLLEATRARTASLPRAAREALLSFALAHRPLTVDAARALAGNHLPGLLDAGFLRREWGRIGFPHDLARRGADSLEGDARQRALLRGAEALLELDPPMASRMFAEGGDAARAREFGLPAARLLVEARELDEACQLARLLGGDRGDVDAGKILVRALYDSGRAVEAAEVGQKLLERNADVDLAFIVGGALRESRDLDGAHEVLRRIDRATEGEMAARIANAKAALLLVRERFDEALMEVGRAEAAAGSIFGLGGNIGLARSVILASLGREGASRRLKERLVSAAPDLVNQRVVASALVNLSNSLAWVGRPVEALRVGRRAARLSRGFGRLPTEGLAHYAVGRTLLSLGRCATGVRHLESALLRLETAARPLQAAPVLFEMAAALFLSGRPSEADARLLRGESLPGATSLNHSTRVHARGLRAWLGGDASAAAALCEEWLGQNPAVAGDGVGVLLARLTEELSDVEAATEAWRAVLPLAQGAHDRAALDHVRVGLASCAFRRGATRLAERYLRPLDRAAFQLRTPVRARALLLRAHIALRSKDPGAAARLAEEAVAVANRTQELPLRAEIYSGVASLLEETDIQRYLRQRTAAASAALLEGAREIWVRYGNETMLRKVELHLSELPRAAADAAAGPEAERLVRVLHIVREMNREFDLDRLLGLILDRAIELTQAERGFILLLREGRGEMHLARNIDREAISEPEAKVSTQVVKEVFDTGRMVICENAEEDPRFEESLSVRQLRLRSIVAVPFRSKGRTIGALYLDNRFRVGNFTEREERLLELFADQAVAAIEKSDLVAELAAKRKEVEELYRQQKQENKEQGRELRRARREVRHHRRARGWGFDQIVSRSVAMQAVIREAKRFANSDIPVLVAGESGTGKELLARATHYASRRQAMPFVAVNCAAFPEALLEAELFGHVRGSFTGADRDRHGLFEEANGGTLFLDEIGDMALPMQVRLLRTLELGEVRRVGDSTVRTVDVRVLSATNVDLDALLRNGKFREDLYYRLTGYVIRIPPLRERMEDLEPLAYSFVEEAARNEGRPDLTISNDAIARLESYTWPGNVRELRNVVMRAAVTAQEQTINPDDIVFDAQSAAILPGFDNAEAERVLAGLAERDLEVNRRQETALMRVLTRGKLSFGEYQQLFRVSKSTAARDLDLLCGSDLLEKRGKTRAVLYHPGPTLREIAKAIGGK